MEKTKDEYAQFGWLTWSTNKLYGPDNEAALSVLIEHTLQTKPNWVKESTVESYHRHCETRRKRLTKK